MKYLTTLAHLFQITWATWLLTLFGALRQVSQASHWIRSWLAVLGRCFIQHIYISYHWESEKRSCSLCVQVFREKWKQLDNLLWLFTCTRGFCAWCCTKTTEQIFLKLGWRKQYGPKKAAFILVWIHDHDWINVEMSAFSQINRK